MASRYRFGRCEVRPMERRVLVDGQPVLLGARAFDLLMALIDSSGALVTKDDLFERVWGGLVVEEANIQVQVSQLRKALGKDVVATVPGRGYRFCAPLEAVPENDTHAAPPTRPSVAVLPFSGAGNDDGLFARGVAYELVLELARNSDLRVVSHHSSFMLAPATMPLLEIGRRLGCRYLIDGSAWRDGEESRISVEMVDCQQGVVVWGTRRELRNEAIPAARDALVRRIAGTLHSSSRYIEMRRALSLPPQSMDVYDMMMRGTALMMRLDTASTHEARALFERALALDSNYAPSFIYLGMLNVFDARWQITGQWSAAREAEYLAQLQRGLTLEPDVPMAYCGLAQAHSLGRRFDLAQDMARRAVELAPSNSDCLQMLAFAQFERGDVEAASRSLDAASELNPLPPPWLHMTYALVRWGQQRLDDALKACDLSAVQMPSLIPVRMVRLTVLAELGRVDEARAEAARLLVVAPWLTTRRMMSSLADTATELRARRLAACRVAGLPD